MSLPICVMFSSPCFLRFASIPCTNSVSFGPPRVLIKTLFRPLNGSDSIRFWTTWGTWRGMGLGKQRGQEIEHGTRKWCKVTGTWSSQLWARKLSTSEIGACASAFHWHSWVCDRHCARVVMLVCTQFLRFCAFKITMYMHFLNICSGCLLILLKLYVVESSSILEIVRTGRISSPFVMAFRETFGSIISQTRGTALCAALWLPKWYLLNILCPTWISLLHEATFWCSGVTPPVGWNVHILPQCVISLTIRRSCWQFARAQSAADPSIQQVCLMHHLVVSDLLL